MYYKDKIKVLEELKEMVIEGYFDSWAKEFCEIDTSASWIDITKGVRDFLECRIIELEQDKEY